VTLPDVAVSEGVTQNVASLANVLHSCAQTSGRTYSKAMQSQYYHVDLVICTSRVTNPSKEPKHPSLHPRHPPPRNTKDKQQASYYHQLKHSIQPTKNAAPLSSVTAPIPVPVHPPLSALVSHVPATFSLNPNNQTSLAIPLVRSPVLDLYLSTWLFHPHHIMLLAYEGMPRLHGLRLMWRCDPSESTLLSIVGGLDSSSFLRV
jgi:hypothetical protein